VEPAADVSARLTVAAPFIASCLILALGPFIALGVESQLGKALKQWLENDTQNCTHEVKLTSYEPETVAKSSLWAIDAAGIAATFFPPLLGIVLLKTGTAANLIYLGSLVVVVAGLFWFLYRVPIDQYHTRGFKIFTPVPIYGAIVNAMAAVAAYAIGP
jgi:hypothetical protein